MKTSIFYENSFGILAQWTGEILDVTETTISIRFSKSKALRFDLSANSDFLLVTEKKVKDLGVCISSASESVSFCEDARNRVIEATKGNVRFHWNGKQFVK